MWELAQGVRTPPWNMRVCTQDLEAPARIALRICPALNRHQVQGISYFVDGSHFRGMGSEDSFAAAWAIIR
eukprot:5635493-Pyramimonas_sp.AAC.1